MYDYVIYKNPNIDRIYPETALNISDMAQGLQVNKKKCSGLSPIAWNAKHSSFRIASITFDFEY